MGGGSWSTTTYSARTSAKRAAGYSTAFAHDEDVKSGRVVAKVHESVDPSKKAGDKSPNAGKIIREAYDSDEHPNSVPIAVVFDETGSMGGIPLVLQQKLPNLHGLLQRKGYVEDPQLLFGAVGDATNNHERAPLQIGQFESDNRGDEQLENFYLEGNGGGGNHESYALAALYLAFFTDLDSVKKRDKKGYLFFIGDERLYASTPISEVEHYIGADAVKQLREQGIEGDEIPTELVFQKLRESFEVFFLFAVQGSHQADQVLPADGRAGDFGWGREAIGWEAILPSDRILHLEEAAAVCETIGGTLGLLEGTADMEDLEDDLKDVGSDLTSVKAATKALATVGAASSGAKLATVEGGDASEL